MKIYNYDSVGILLGESEAAKDPLESGLAKKDVFLVPGFATNKQPPAVGQNEVAVFSNNKWAVAADHRGRLYYLPEDSNQYKMEEIGELPTGAILGENPVAEEEAAAVNDLMEENWTTFDSATTIAALKVAIKKILGR